MLFRSCIPVPEPPIADSSPILTGSQIQCQLIERLFLPGLIVGISLRHRTDVPIIAVTHMDSGLLLNQFKRVKSHCAIRLPLHQPATVPIDLKSIGPLYDRCKVSRQTKRIIGEEVFRQPHGSGILVPLCGRISASAVFIPLQADLLDQKRGQVLRPFSFISSHG